MNRSRKGTEQMPRVPGRWRIALSAIAIAWFVGVALAAATASVGHVRVSRARFPPSAAPEPPARQTPAAGRSQAPPPANAQMAETVFKNVQVLKGISADDFMAAMGL